MSDQKIVINACFGGFGLSEAAIRAYAERKGWTLYPMKNTYGTVTWSQVPPEERAPMPEPWHSAPLAERAAYNATCKAQTLYDNDIPRDDADLVAVVEALGEKANGPHAKLEVVEVPEGVTWTIEEYDGSECVAEAHRVWGPRG